MKRTSARCGPGVVTPLWRGWTRAQLLWELKPQLGLTALAHVWRKPSQLVRPMFWIIAQYFMEKCSSSPRLRCYWGYIHHPKDCEDLDLAFETANSRLWLVGFHQPRLSAALSSSSEAGLAAGSLNHSSKSRDKCLIIVLCTIRIFSHRVKFPYMPERFFQDTITHWSRSWENSVNLHRGRTTLTLSLRQINKSFMRHPQTCKQLALHSLINTTNTFKKFHKYVTLDSADSDCR